MPIIKCSCEALARCSKILNLESNCRISAARVLLILRLRAAVRPISDGPQLRVALLRQFTSALVPPQAVYCSVGTSNLVGVFSTLRQVRPEG